MVEEVTHRYHIFGSGLYVWALQVYTKRVISELVLEVIFESKNLLHYTFVNNKISRLDSHSILSHSGPFVPFIIY
jgi:hypothetical protein